MRLLTEHGADADVARFAVTHASWSASDRTIDDLLVALADKLWKGKREETLEQRAMSANSRSNWQTAGDVGEFKIRLR